MVDPDLGKLVNEAAAEEGVRKVEVEITHKHEGNSSATTWAIAIGVVLILGIAGFYVAGNSEGLLSGADETIGDCADGKDNDGDTRVDREDPGCTNTFTQEYDPERSEDSR
jgi:hypothetical protein